MQFLGRQFSSQSTHEVVRFNSTRPRVRIACPCDRAGLLESRVSCHHPIYASFLFSFRSQVCDAKHLANRKPSRA